LIGSFVLFTQVLSAQKNADSIIDFATNQIYENPNLAIETAQALFDDSESTTDIKVRALIVISTAYSSKREYEKSLEYSRHAMDMLPKIQNIKLKIRLLNRVGGQYQELNVYDKALTYLDEAYKLLESLPESTNKLEAMGFNNLVRGFIYREQMSCETALDYFNRSIEAYQKISPEVNKNSNLSIAYYNKGNCLITTNKIDDAEASFLQAIAYAKKNNAKSLIAFAQKGLAEVYTLKGNNLMAINLLEEALQNSEEVGDKILNRSIYRALAENYLAENDLKNYSLYHDKNLSIHKEIIKTERKTIDSSIQNIIEVNSKKVEDLQNKNILFRALLIFVIVVVIVFLIRLISSSEKTLKSLKQELKF
jgi:tetratricopeptide (TPR) repeat protein